MREEDLDTVEISEEHLNLISETSTLNDLTQLTSDFKKLLFHGYVCFDKNSKVGLSYLIYYYSYSTWENRVIYLSKVWLKENLEGDIKRLVFKKIANALLDKARERKCNRINFDVKLNRDEEISELFVTITKGVNLTLQEEWNFFKMDLDVMKLFAQVDREKYEIFIGDKKIILREFNLKGDPAFVCGLIRELAIFEKMEDQFQLKPEDLIRDYSSNGDYSFYQCLVAEDTTTNTLVAFALYYYKYSLEFGRGCYLEDLYVQPNWRGKSIGTLLWRKVVDRCLNDGASYLEWSCLAWNTPAIEFYHKNKAYNTTKESNINLFRITKDKIHQ